MKFSIDLQRDSDNTDAGEMDAEFDDEGTVRDGSVTFWLSGPSRCIRVRVSELRMLVAAIDARSGFMNVKTGPNSDTHPWGAFLHARARCLRWLRDEMGESPSKIAATMCMDAVQVRLILDHVDSSPNEYPPEEA